MQVRDQRPRRHFNRADYIRRLQSGIERALVSMAKAKARYKRDFDKSVRPTRPIVAGKLIFLDTHDGLSKRPKLSHNIAGPFEVLEVHDNILSIDRDGIVERVSANRCVKAPYHKAPPRNPFAATAVDMANKHHEGESYYFKSICSIMTGVILSADSINQFFLEGFQRLENKVI